MITIDTKQSSKKSTCIEEKITIRLTFNPLSGFQTILPCIPIGKPALGQRSTTKKDATSMSSKLEPVIWSRDTGQWILCFDRCQLIIVWMSTIEKVHGKPRLYVSVNLCFGVWRHFARLHRRHCHVYAPTSNAASHDNHAKINFMKSWVSFSFLYECGAPLGDSSG